jgi:hypothetical protein
MKAHTSSLISTLEEGGWLESRPGQFTPGNIPVPILGGSVAPRMVRTCAENLAPIGIRFPNRPANGKPLPRQHYPGHHLLNILS